MKAVNWIIALACFLLLIRCAPLGIIPTGSEEHKATILFFRGGSGRIDKNNKGGLYGRSKYYFESRGIKMEFISFDFHTAFIMGPKVRTTDSHVKVIQKKVDNLRKEGHERIWLMGESNGAVSVRQAGASNIQGVKGLIVINPPAESFNYITASGNFVDLKRITLPILMVTHEMDRSGIKYWSKQYLRFVYPSSANPEMVTLSGGRIGASKEPSHKNQKYAHELQGVEKELAQAVSNFIDSNSDISETGT